jgi:hypothetical protein
MPSVQRRRRSPLKSWWIRRNLSGVYWAERNLPWLFGPPLTQPGLPAELYTRLHRLLAADTRRLGALSGCAFAHWQTAAPEPARAPRELEAALG